MLSRRFWLVMGFIENKSNIGEGRRPWKRSDSMPGFGEKEGGAWSRRTADKYIQPPTLRTAMDPSPDGS